MRGILLFIWETIKIALIALVIVVPIRYFLFQPFFVMGESMQPNFENGDYLLIDEISYRFIEPHRGEVLVFKCPQNPSQRYIKRIVGLPGETVDIENGKVMIFSDAGNSVLDESEYLGSFVKTPGDVRISLGENEYFVLGDNRVASSDSRTWGVLPEENIIGRVFVRAWPFAAFAKFEAPSYEPR